MKKPRPSNLIFNNLILLFQNHEDYYFKPTYGIKILVSNFVINKKIKTESEDKREGGREKKRERAKGKKGKNDQKKKRNKKRKKRK